MIYTCGEGHEINIYLVNGVETVIINDFTTGKLIKKIVPESEGRLQEMREKLLDGECPICDKWETKA